MVSVNQVGTKGKIIKSIAGSCLVRFEDGQLIDCKPRGKLRLGPLRPLAGDDVVVGYEGENAFVSEILPRRNTLARPAAANVDVLFITVAPAQPLPALSIIDKVIAVAEYNDILPVILVSKADVDPDFAARLGDLYGKCGIETFVTSVVAGQGIDQLSAYLGDLAKDDTVVFCGSSGVGKSSLMNALFAQLAIAVGKLSDKTGRGRHTTREVALYPAADLMDESFCGYIGDTPGFTLLDFDMIDIFDAAKLAFGFREMVPFLGQCKYTKCTHTSEDGCAIIAAAQRGEIALSRHESYVQIYNDIKDKRDWQGK